jgi:hypothetical protein
LNSTDVPKSLYICIIANLQQKHNVAAQSQSVSPHSPIDEKAQAQPDAAAGLAVLPSASFASHWTLQDAHGLLYWDIWAEDRTDRCLRRLSALILLLPGRLRCRVCFAGEMSAAAVRRAVDAT